MAKYTVQLITLAAILALSGASAVFAETWRLDKGGDLTAVSESPQDQYLRSVAQIKKLVTTGKKKEVRQAWEQLKKDYPEIAGDDLDAFIEAEILFSEGKFGKAVRAYDEFLDKYPQSRLYEVALERQASIANAFLQGQKRTVLGFLTLKGYSEGEKIMERISDRAGDSPIGIEGSVAVAESFEDRGRFGEAYGKWSEISSRQPSGKIGQDSLLGMARSKHAAYRGPKYDASDLVSARSYYENYGLKFPTDARQFGINGKLTLIEEQRAHKQFTIGQYYQQSGGTQAANLYYRMVIENWPNSTAAEMAAKAIQQEKPGAMGQKPLQKKIMKKLEELVLGKDKGAK